MKKQRLNVLFGEILLDPKTNLAENTIFFHVGYGGSRSTVYVLPESLLVCKTLCADSLFKDVTLPHSRFCMFETDINIERLRAIFKDFDVFYTRTDPKLKSVNIKRLVTF